MQLASRWLRSARGLASFALLVAVLIAPAPISSQDDAGSPLREEDVVQRFVTGTPVEELITLIRASDVAFELEPEMVDELRVAGIPEELIQAMIERQAEVDRAKGVPVEEPGPVEVEEPATYTLTMHIIAASADEEEDADETAEAETGNEELGAAPSEPSSLEMIDVVPAHVAEAFGLPSESATFTDVALFVACHTSDHVPDHWRGKSPLGRDFNSVSRHKMLAFLPGAKVHESGSATAKLPAGSDPRLQNARILELQIPPTIEVDLEPAVAHDLALGVAVQAGGRYFLIVAAEWSGVVLEKASELDVRVRLPDDPLVPDIEIAFDTESFR
jgi:hypothetical protein